LIDYESAREAWLNEILSDDLQPLSPDFLIDLRRSIQEVEGKVSEADGSEPLRSLLVAEGEQLKVFYDRIMQERLLKILLHASRGKKPRSLSEDEKKLFKEAKGLSDPYKERFYRILEDETPTPPPIGTTPEPATAKPSGTGDGAVEEGVPERGDKRLPRPDRNKMLRILVDFPRFVGPDMRNYGPLGREDVVALPDEVSEILLARRAGERIGAGEDSEDAEED